jgi:FtsP/CotA-like multicopper oxidase with cupredoxin domain
MQRQVVRHRGNVVAAVGSIVKLVRRLRARREIDRSPALLNSAALLTLGAAAIHFGVAPEHLAEFTPYGVFFIGLGIAQIGLAAAVVLVPSRRLFALAAAGTAAVIGLCLLSRTVGVPIAPIPWRPEPVGLPDVVATLLEGISVIQFLRLFRRPGRPRRAGRIRVALKMVPMVLFVPLATYLGLGAAMAPMPVAYNVAPAVPGRASTSVFDLTAPQGSEPVKSFTLTSFVSAVAGHDAWTFNGTVPGPELRVTQGDRVRVKLVNQLPDPTSIHWHGIRVPGAHDGVAGITQNAVPPGRSHTYEFIANDAGTFWYHSHQGASNQVPRGLLGAITVEPRAPAVRERDYSLMVHLLPGTDTIAVNGSPKLHVEAAPGEIVRLRVTNGAQPGFDGAPLTPVLLGAPYVVAALDGHDLNAPHELGPERIPLGMGQRADLVFRMPASGAVSLVGIKGVAPFLPFGPPQSTASVTIGDGPVPAAVNVATLPRFDLTSYGLPASDPVADTGRYDVTREIVLNGGPMFRNGGWDFSDTFNGMASPNIPPIRVVEGQLVRLHFVNRSPKFHPIHIHGHVFSVLARNGRPLSGSPVHVDAIQVGPDETWDVAFKADNPGIWMLHCHVLSHAVAGMSMTINYQGISTPFTMGMRSGNVPE